MKRIAALGLASVLVVGAATVFVADSYGFLWFGKDKKYEKTIFSVDGMTCEGCQSAVGAALEKVDGVKCAKVDYTTGKAEVCYEKKTKVETLNAAIVEVGFTVTGFEAGTCAHGASNGCAGEAGAAKAEGAGCCTAGAKKVSAGASGGCAFSGAKQASAEGAAGCGRHAASTDHAQGCARGAGAKATSGDGNGSSTSTKSGGSCTHGGEATKSTSTAKGQQS